MKNQRIRGRPFSKVNPSRLWGLVEDPDLQQSELLPPSGSVITIPWVNGGQKNASQIIVSVNACIESEFLQSEIVRLREGRIK